MPEYNLIVNRDELYHYGVKGMRWGHRKPKRDSSKSKHRLRLEEKYRYNGMSAKQASHAAERRIKTEKIVGTLAITALTAASIYAGHQYVQEYMDKVISAGSKLQRIEGRNINNVHDVFYAANNKRDKLKYSAMLGRTRQLQTGESYVMKILSEKDIKVASRQNAIKVFKDVYKSNPSFKAYVDKNAMRNIHGMNEVTKKTSDMFGKIYDNFNSKLVELHDKPEAKVFYDALKQKGYSAIQDMNDMKFSGYKANNPLIVFDKAKVSVNSVTKMSTEMINDSIAKNNKITKIENTVSTYFNPKTIAIGSGYISGLGIYVRSINTVAINKYRKEHPNSELSDSEIIKILSKKEVS